MVESKATRRLVQRPVHGAPCLRLQGLSSTSTEIQVADRLSVVDRRTVDLQAVDRQFRHSFRSPSEDRSSSQEVPLLVALVALLVRLSGRLRSFQVRKVGDQAAVVAAAVVAAAVEGSDGFLRPHGLQVRLADNRTRSGCGHSRAGSASQAWTGVSGEPPPP
jgi:hypothetical protein